MPFLVDSVTMEVNRLGLALHSAIHPVFRVWRGKSGAIERIGLGHSDAGQTQGQTQPDAQSALESFIHFEVDRCGEAAKLDELRDEHRARARRRARGREDWPKIVDIARATIGELKAQRGEPGWQRSARVPRMDGRGSLHVPRPSRLRTRHAGRRVCLARAWPVPARASCAKRCARLRGADVTLLPPAAASIIEGATPIFLTKANSRATVHRPGYLDYVGVKRDRAGWQGHRRAALSRALYIDRLSRADLRDSDRAAQVREHRAARGLSRERSSGTSR